MKKLISIVAVLILSFSSVSYAKTARENLSIGEKYYHKKDYKSALKYFKKSAKQGDADAQFNIGYMYSQGKGVTRDKTQAIKWYTKAAEQGKANASYNLALEYQYGCKNIKRDYSQMIKWYAKSVLDGNLSALSEFDDLERVTRTEEDKKELQNAFIANIKYLIKLAKKGHKDIQFRLAMIYADSERIKEDYSKAVKWLTKTTKDENFSMAFDYKPQYQLGMMYYKGQGVKKDYSQAVKLLTKPAERGNANAQYYLAMMYQEGQGVEQSDSNAIIWLKKAAKNGDGTAQELLKKQGVKY